MQKKIFKKYTLFSKKIKIFLLINLFFIIILSPKQTYSFWKKSNTNNNNTSQDIKTTKKTDLEIKNKENDINKTNNNNKNNTSNTNNNSPEKENIDDKIFEGSGIYGEVLRLASEKHYYPEKNIEKAISKSIEAFLNALDPHSNYLNKKLYKSILETTSGQFFGIGIEIDNTRSTKDKFLTVLRTIPGGPAEKAGLLSFDKIIEIDDKKLDGMTTEEATIKLKGPKNSTVKVKVLRENKKEPISFEITRDVVKAKTSFAFYLKNYDVYYICLTTFSSTSLKQIKDILAKSSKFPYKGLIIDLRNNSGGLLTSVVDICGLFLEKNSLVVTTKDKYGKKKEECRTTTAPIANLNIPIFILVNNYTASASEILAGCLKIHSENSYKQKNISPNNPGLLPIGQENLLQIKTPTANILNPINTISEITEKAKNISKNLNFEKNPSLLTFIVGTKTFGKGSVQEIIPVSNNSAIKLTTCLYFLPDDTTIQGKGIKPDFIVEKLFPAPEKITWFLDHYGREKSLKHSIDPLNINLNKTNKNINESNDNSNNSKELAKEKQKEKTDKYKKWDKLPGQNSKNKKDLTNMNWIERTKEALAQDNQFLEALKLINIFDIAKNKFPEKLTSRESALQFLKEISALNKKIDMNEISAETSTD